MTTPMTDTHPWASTVWMFMMSTCYHHYGWCAPGLLPDMAWLCRPPSRPPSTLSALCLTLARPFTFLLQDTQLFKRFLTAMLSGRKKTGSSLLLLILYAALSGLCPLTRKDHDHQEKVAIKGQKGCSQVQQ